MPKIARLSKADPVLICSGNDESLSDQIGLSSPETASLSGTDSILLESTDEESLPLQIGPTSTETGPLAHGGTILLGSSNEGSFSNQISQTLPETATLLEPDPVPLPYRICPVDGKGLGMLATKKFSRGEQVFSEKPLIRTTRAANNRMAFEQYDMLGKLDQEKIQALANIQPEKAQPLGAIWTNAIALRGTEEEIGLFAMASRMNHSCRPNTNNVWDPKAEQMTVVAVRDIEAGEEITSNYIEGFARRDDRRRHLWHLLRFQCCCELCMLPLKLRNRSDHYIDEINGIRNKMKVAAKWQNNSGVLADLRKLLDLYQKEGITDWHVAAAYDKAHGIARDNGDGYRVHLFAQRAAEEFAWAEGYDSPNAERMRRNAENSAILIKEGEASGIPYEKPPADEGVELEKWLFRDPKRVLGDCWYSSWES